MDAASEYQVLELAVAPTRCPLGEVAAQSAAEIARHAHVDDLPPPAPDRVYARARCDPVERTHLIAVAGVPPRLFRQGDRQSLGRFQ